MSLASHAVKRLLDLCSSVFARVAGNECRLRGPLAGGRLPILSIESLEQRVLLSGSPWANITGSWSQTYDGSFSAIAVAPTAPSTIYVASGVPGGGVFKSTDSGQTWQAKDSGFPSLYPAISRIAISPSNPNVIYVGTVIDTSGVGNPCLNGNVYKSTNGGDSWQRVDGTTNWLGVSQLQNSVYSLAVSPTDSNVVFAGVTGQGLLKTTDGGGSWTKVYPAALVDSGEIDYFTSIDFSPADSNTLYLSGVASINGSLPFLFEDAPSIDFIGADPIGPLKSTDGGQTWKHISLPMGAPTLWIFNSPPMVTDIAIGTLSGNIYASTTAYETPFPYLSINNAGVLVSPDGGANWSFANNSSIGDLSQYPILRVQAFPNGFGDRLFAVAGSLKGTLLTSTDAGSSWQALPPFPAPGVISEVAMVGNTVVALTSEGIYTADIAILTPTPSTAPTITSVSPAQFIAPSSGTTPITIYGTGFTPSSTLVFTDPAGNRWPAKSAPTYVSSTQLTYALNVGGAAGQWSVEVDDNGQQSNAGSVAVQPAADTTPPVAILADPVNGGVIAQSTINSRCYIDVTFSDTGGSGLNRATITDAGQEFSIGGVTITGGPTLVSGNTYRYTFTGSLPLGSINVAFPAGTWADNSGNVNHAFTQTFTVSAKPVITSVTPSSLQPLPADQRQLITLSGSGFSASSTLNFISALGNYYPGRVPTYNATTGQLSYYVSVGTAQGQWTVQVVTNGVASEPFAFMVQTLPSAAVPTISPNGGSYNNFVQVSLSTATTGATLRYTLDGTDPTAGSALYNNPLTLSTSLTLKARAFKSGMADSAVASAAFAVAASAVAPAITSVSPSLLQPTNNIQSISIYGNGFLPGCLLYFYDPSGNLVQNNQTEYLSSGRLDYGLGVRSQSGTWTVKVVNDPYGSPQTSALVPFTVAQPPTGNYPIQASPANGEPGVVRTPTLTWQSVPGADLYRVTVSDNPALLPTNPTVDTGGNVWNSPTNTLQQFLSSLESPGKTYYWEVKARIGGVWNAWSPIWSYTIAGELNLPPVVQSGAVTPTTVTQGESLTFSASGVSDPNLAPDHVNSVLWCIESNGIPGLQINTANDDSRMIGDGDGSDGWSATINTGGSPFSALPWDPGTHTVYTVAKDSHGLYSTPAPSFSFTVLPANVAAPVIQSVQFDPGATSGALRVAFNVDVSANMQLGSFEILPAGSPQQQSVSYDRATNIATLDLNATSLPNGDYSLYVWDRDNIYNVAGVGLQGPTSYSFFALAGDANRDRIVDSQDYTLVEQNLNMGGGKGWADGDFNGDGMVDTTDLQILQANMGQSLPALTGAPAQPLNILPASSAASIPLAPLLQSSTFGDPDGDIHFASQWVVTRTSDSIVVFNSGEDPTNKISIPVGTLAGGTSYSWKVRYEDSQGTWSYYSSPTSFTTLTALPGDFNGDGVVNGQDFLTWQTHYPTLSGATLAIGDANGDGMVNGADFLIWQQNYNPLGTTVTSQSQTAAVANQFATPVTPSVVAVGTADLLAAKIGPAASMPLPVPSDFEGLVAKSASFPQLLRLVPGPARVTAYVNRGAGSPVADAIHVEPSTHWRFATRPSATLPGGPLVEAEVEADVLASVQRL